MAHCPKCGKKLKLTDLSQFCPACGVNMRFVNFEENFYREAKLAELSQAAMHVKIKRLKAAFIGSKLTVARLAVMLLPIAALLLPNGGFRLLIPFLGEGEAVGSFSALGIYNLYSNGVLNYLLAMTDSVLAGPAFTALRTALFSYAAVAVFGVIVFLLSVLCFLSVRNMQKLIAGFAAGGVVSCAVSMILIGSFARAAQNVPLIEGRGGYGLLLSAAMFCAVIAVNALLIKKGIPVEYAEGMEERVAIYKKVRSGETDLDSLPQPVVETEETRKIDEEIAKEEDSYRKKHAEGGVAVG